MKNSKRFRKSERGIASVEAVLLLSIFVVFMTYCVGTFGVIHTGILNSISARAYTFETMRNRSNVIYFRDVSHFAKHGLRIHGITTEKSMNDSSGNLKWDVTERTLVKGRNPAGNPGRQDTNPNDLNIGKKELGRIDPYSGVWIKTVYGICLDYKCGGN